MSDVKLYSFLDYIYINANSDDYKMFMKSGKKIDVYLDDVRQEGVFCVHTYKEPGVNNLGWVARYTTWPPTFDRVKDEVYTEQVNGVVRWEVVDIDDEVS